ncbi:MAG: hypothetical protein JWO09_2552 [Bacteroidetes bacterium]|nr:hypothetical protein [Bacteroidota bacterium]
MTNEEKINLIGQKIMLLSNTLDNYKTELDQLRQELAALQRGQTNPEPAIVPPPAVNIPEVKQEIWKEVVLEEQITEKPPVMSQPVKISTPVPPKAKPASTFNLEEFVGGKLISIVGIVVLVIGLSIGVKYAIDRNLITPLTRIVLAYVAGGILLAIAFRLKQNYKAFSAILLSGGMASLYFTTFAAYSMYDLFPQMAAFAIMVVFTAFTVFAATVYELEVIGIIGLVGAYAVPVLLSDGSGKIHVMFSYMLIINTGILVLSFKKYWQVLNHIAFGLSWLIVGGWAAAKYDHTIHFPMAMIFSFLFFIIFYISNMSYKILKQEKFGVIDIVRLLSNSFIFFAIGYGLLNNDAYSDYLGMFTLANALVHLVFSYIVFRNKLLDRKLFYLLIAMVLTFITIAVPVQLEGSWVTLSWSAEAALLFIIGRYKAVRFYEWLGAIMISLSVLSLLEDWSHTYYVSYYDTLLFKFWTPFLNIHMFTSLFFVAALGSMTYVHFGKKLPPEERAAARIYPLLDYLFPALLLVFTYLTFGNEINAFFKAKYEQSFLSVPDKEYGNVTEIYDYSWQKLQGIASGLYSLFFFCIVTQLAIRRWNNPVVRWGAFIFNMLCAFIFILAGLHMLGELRSEYLAQNSSEYYQLSQPVIFLRYVCFGMLGLLLFLTHLLLKTETFARFSISRVYAGCIVHFFILVILSNELINLNILNNYDIANEYYTGTNAAYKMGFTVLWGIYSFILIAWGIFKRNRTMRISAISLFGITLVKLVTYDTWDLSTGYKIIAFILLGVILLVVAFLYQKFKVLIFGEDGRS